MLDSVSKENKILDLDESQVVIEISQNYFTHHLLCLKGRVKLIEWRCCLLGGSCIWVDYDGC